MSKKSKSGYIEIDNNYNMGNHNYSLPVSEQEVSIVFTRDEDFATIYASDTTYITKLDKLCKTSPEYYSLTKDTGRGKMYKCEDKTLISFRQKKKEMSEENKAKASERFKELHKEGKIGRKKKMSDDVS